MCNVSSHQLTSAHVSSHQLTSGNGSSSCWVAGSHAFEIFALVISAQYAKLADRFLGVMPPEAESAVLGPSDVSLRITREKAMADLAARGIGCQLAKPEVRSDATRDRKSVV